MVVWITFNRVTGYFSLKYFLIGLNNGFLRNFPKLNEGEMMRSM